MLARHGPRNRSARVLPENSTPGGKLRDSDDIGSIERKEHVVKLGGARA